MMLVMGPSQNFWGMLIFIRRRMHNKKNSWKIKIFFFQRIYAYFYCRKSMAKAFDHAPKFPSCVSKLEANGSTCHPFIGGQKHRQ
jgi:hypothetical protein